MADSYNMSDVFISYSRRDVEFVKTLFADIKSRGKEVWADFEDIPKAADWWQEIQAGIDAADAFVFVISPDSIKSEVCRREIEHAVASNKRFLPLLYREIVDAEDKAAMHSAISSHNWIYFRDTDDYHSAFETLINSVETDLEHNRNLTRILVRAKDWESHNKAPAYLLVGQDLDSAEAWLATGMSKKPTPTNLHAEFIRASHLASARRQRTMLGIVSAGLVISLLLAVYALYQTFQADAARREAEVAQSDAELARNDALNSAEYARTLALAATSSDALSNNNPDLSLVLALEAFNINTAVQPPQVYNALANAAYAPSTRLLIETGDNVPTALVYSPDGHQFAAGYINGEICLYDGVSAHEDGCLFTGEASAHSAPVLWMHMTTDGSHLLSSAEDNRLVYWDISSEVSGTIVSELSFEEGISSSVLSSDGNFAVFGLADGRIGFWDLSSFEVSYFSDLSLADENGEMLPTGIAITALALSKDTNLLISGGADGEAKLWDVSSRSFAGTYMYNPQNPAPITSLAISPDNTFALVGDNDAVISFYDLESAGILTRTIQGHNESIRTIVFSVTGRSFFTASWDNSIREWDIATGREINAYRGHNGGVNALALSADNLLMVSGSYDTSLRLWHVRAPIFEVQHTTNWQEENGRTALDVPVNSADWNERIIVTGHSDGTVLILDRLRGTVLQRFSNPGKSAISVTLSSSQQEIFVVFQSCEVAMYGVEGQILWARSLPRLADETCRFGKFRPDSQEVLVVTGHILQLLDVRDGGDRRRVPYNPERDPRLLSAAFTPDGQRLMIGENYFEDNLHLVEVATGEIIHHFHGHSDGILSIDISDDGTRAVTGGFDNDVRVWNIETGAPLQLLEGHSDRILSVEFSPDGHYAISADNARTIRLWNLDTSFTAYTYQGHTNRVTAAHFSPDGRRILTASHDSTVIIWKFPQPINELVSWARANRYLRELSCSDLRLYVDSTLTCPEATEAPEATAAP